MYDVIILGAGPAGISASLYTHRANKKTLILYQEKATLEKAKLIENYYGFENGISGENLYKAGIKQAKNLGIEIKKEEIIKIEMIANGFQVKTTEREYKAKTIIFAIGTKKKSLDIKGIKEFEGKGISYCAICDGFFYKNKDVAVLGSGKYAVSETNDLLQLANKITILTNGQKAPEFRADNVSVITKPIIEIVGDTRVKEVRFKDNTTILTEGIFVAEGIAGTTEFAKKLGLLIKNDKIIVNEKMETNIPGIFACGDCTGGLYQISKAVHEGMIAGIQAGVFVKNKEDKI